MSLPAKPWPPEKVQALYARARDMLKRAVKPYNRRLMKRADRIAERSFALWFQTKDVDPHAPASTRGLGYGTRKPRR